MLIYWIINKNINKDIDVNNDNNNNSANSNSNSVIQIEFDLRALHSHICRKNNKHNFVNKLGACFFKHLCL